MKSKLKRKRDNKEIVNHQNKRRKIEHSNLKKSKDLIKLLSETKYIKRFYDIFQSIFAFYNHNDIEFINKNKIYYKLENIILEFCNLILQSDGEFQISDDFIFLFEDKRFFISLYFMFPHELNKINNLIGNKLCINPVFSNTKLFDTIPIKYKLTDKIRLKFLYCFLRYVAQEIKIYFNSELKITMEERFQYKIILSKKMIWICKQISSEYQINLDLNKKMFEVLIKEAKNEYNEKKIINNK